MHHLTTFSGDTSGQVGRVMGSRMDVAVLAAGELPRIFSDDPGPAGEVGTTNRNKKRIGTVSRGDPCQRISDRRPAVSVAAASQARRHARAVEAALDRTEIIGLNVIFGRAAALHWKDDCAWHCVLVVSGQTSGRKLARALLAPAVGGSRVLFLVCRIDFPGNEQGECLEKGKLQVRVSDSEGVQAERRGFEGSRGGGVESEKKWTRRGEVKRGDSDGRIGGQGKLKLL
ncbi:hypothetical protein CMUS01_10184 [Colletotrichum musicola]|uniref:Uncharacterized protein n=1 Tax=Colletotrichum musicola TaxID=2175873 RepID=A0A8H6N8S6_9PEZI|nr:hypothetical protein CMUS01_10184 [Colletotrichum musicola]